MFNSKKNLQLIDYQDSYYFRQQRKKRRNKWIKLSFLVLLIVSLALVFAPFAKSNEIDLKQLTKNSNALIHGPQLIFEHPNPAMAATFPVDIEANIEVNGLVAYAEIKQIFINPHAVELEGKYQFPLPENSAVKQLRIKVGDKEIIGEIMEKKAAKTIYQQAKRQGKKASLLEQQRPNLFTNKIANIPAYSTVVVTLKFVMPVSFSNGEFTFTLPLALTERYQPKSYNQSLDEQKSTSSAPHLRSIARSQSSINIALNSDIPITSISSESHNISLRELNSQQDTYFITLDKTKVISNKSFILRWKLLPSSQPQVSSFSQQISGEHYTLLTFFPPTYEAAQVITRDIIFIIDTSGSMQGQSMEQAKTSLQHAIFQLSDKDSFNIIAFDDDTELLFPVTQIASEKNIKESLLFIDGLSADGGTQMYRPLSNALMMKKNKVQSPKAIRQIVFITDGAVGNEFELMELLNAAQGDFRLYTVGIGAAPNGYFMKKAAQFGRGSYVFIQNLHDVQKKMTNFMTKISQPAISNIELIFDSQVHQHVEVYPKNMPDLYFGEPLQIALKSQFSISSVQLTGETVATPWYQQLVVDGSRQAKGISSLWARRKIESLLDTLVTGADKEAVKSQVISTSLNHQIISPYTSFIAVEKQPDIPSLHDTKNNVLSAHESLMVAMPQTSLNWQLQMLIGMSLLLLWKISHSIWLGRRHE